MSMVALERDGQVARITLHRAAARNAVIIAGWSELAERIRDAAAAHVIILSGEAGHFSAGADLVELAGLAEDVDARGAFRRAMDEGIAAVAASPVPVVASVRGGCFGAAVALALACDIRVATPDARFGIPPARFGIAYPQGDVDRLVATVGRGAASRLLLGAETIDASEAARIGLVDLVAEDAGEGLACAIAGNVHGSVALLRRQIDGLERGEGDRAFEDRFGSPEFAAVATGIRARRA